MLTAFAPAKINLCLHVTGRRADGYHLLDSLVTFAGCGDTLTAADHHAITLEIGGRFGAGLSSGPDNLVWRAAETLARRLDHPVGAALRLDKSLPVASGIGGGSSDAAATLRLLCELWTVPDHIRADLPDLALSIGADVPVCLASRPARMRGVGDRLDPVTLPSFGLVLVNPCRSVSTRDVFQAWRRSGAPCSAPLAVPDFADATALADWLRLQSNDLQTPALAICPAIGDVLHALAQTPDCLLTRMSGSGATCFALYQNAQHATLAAATLADRAWWSWSG